MAKCSLTLDVDHPLDMPLVPGEALTGHVVVDVDQSVKCRKLTLDFGWRTHGSGNRASGPPARLVLFEGTWETGELARYPFRFDVPAGPDTYHGHHLNVDWYLTANADIPWAFDPKAEVDLLMDARHSETYDHGPRFAPSFSGAGGMISSVGKTVVGVFMMVFSLVFMCFGLAATSEFGLLGLLFGVIPLGMFGAGVWLVFTAWQSKIAETLLGEVSVEVPDMLVPGESFTALVHCQPVRGLTLNALNLKLIGREVVVRGSGTNRSTYEHVVHEDLQTSRQDHVMQAGEQAIFEQSFTIPTDAGPSFAAPDNALTWAVEVHFDIPRFPDWYGTQVIGVRTRA